MKLAYRSALFGLVCASLPLAVACGSNDSSSLFSTTAGSTGAGVSGSLGSSGSTGHAGQGSGGAPLGSSGASGAQNHAGQGNGGADTGGGNGGAGSGGLAGMGTGSGGANVGGGGNSGAGMGGVGAGNGGAGASAGGMSGGGTSGGGTSGGGTSGSGMGGGGASAGGSSGSAGAAGSGGAGCPDTAPQDGGVCMVQTPDSCFYPGQACSCLSEGNVAGKHWGCFVGTPEKCPTGVDNHPTEGASCVGANGAICPYSSNDFCVCSSLSSGTGGGNGPSWSCLRKQTTCPAAKPGSTLCGEVKECAYGDRECFCAGTGKLWSCE